MQRFYEKTSNVIAIIGVLICIFSGLYRVTGEFYIAGFELLTLYNVGIGMMIFGILLKLELILNKVKKSGQRL